VRSLWVERSARGAPRILLDRPSGRLSIAVTVSLLAYVAELTLSGLTGETRLGPDLPPWGVALLALPLFVALLWRRDRPWTVFLIGIVQATVIALLIPTYQPFAGNLVALYALARHRPMRDTLIGLALLAIPWTIITVVNVSAIPGNGPAQVIGAMAVYWGAAFVMVAMGKSQRRAREIYALRSRAREAELAIRMQEERLRLAHELHDRVANSVAAVLVGLDGMQRHVEVMPAPAARTMDLTHVSARQAMREIRDVLGVLRTTDPLEPTGHDDTEDLETVLSELQTNGLAGVDTDVRSVGDPVTLPPAVDGCAARCVREAVTNAVKYGVELVQIEVDWRPDPFVILVRNANGERQLVDPSMSGGLGLGGIITKVAEVGGSVRLESEADVFTLELRLPRG
jgi:signal transduction histidine kinase